MAQPETEAVIKYKAVIEYKLIKLKLRHNGIRYDIGQFSDFDGHFLVDPECGSIKELDPKELRTNPYLLHCFAVGKGSDEKSLKNKDSDKKSPKYKNSNRIFLEIFDRSLSKHVEVLAEQGVHPLMTKVIPLEKDSSSRIKKVWYVPKVYREYMRCMVQFLVSIHKEGYCTKGFRLPNIVIKDNTIKFLGLKFDKPNKEKQTERVKRDFDNLCDAVLEIYSDFEDQLPPDFRNWIHNLRNHNGEVNDMLVNHLATLSSHDRLNFVSKVFEKHEELFKQEFESIPKPARHWTSRIEPSHGPLMVCLKRNPGGGTSQQPTHYVVGKEQWYQLMQFCRNYIAHCNDYADKFDPPRRFSDDFIDASLFSLFGEEICMFGAYRFTTIQEPKDFSKYLPSAAIDPVLSSFYPLITMHKDPSHPEDLTANYALNSQGLSHNNIDYKCGVFLSDSNVEFFIDSQDYSAEVHKPVWPSTNPHMLRCFLIDKFNKMFLEKFDKALLEQVKELKANLHIEPLMKEELSPQTGSDQENTKTIWYVPKVYREFMKSMVHFLVSIHETGYCTNGFEDWNIVVTKNNIVKFFGLTYVKPETKQNFEERVKSDFNTLGGILRKIFNGYEDKFPPDFRIWVDDLSKYDGNFHDIFVDHLATSSPSSRLRFVRDLSEKRGDTGLTVNYTLWHIEKFADKWFDRIKPDHGPLKVCSVSWLKPDKDDPKKQLNVYEVAENKEIAFFDFCRNYVVHCKEYEDQVDPRMDLNEEAVDASLFSLFGKELCQIQSEGHRLSGRMNLPIEKRIQGEMQDGKAN